MAFRRWMLRKIFLPIIQRQMVCPLMRFPVLWLIIWDGYVWVPVTAYVFLIRGKKPLFHLISTTVFAQTKSTNNLLTACGMECLLILPITDLLFLSLRRSRQKN